MKRLEWLLMALFVAGSGMVALGLDSPGGPTDAASEMYSLEAVYDRLDTGASGTPSAFSEPSAGPAAGVGRTLDEVMSVAPATHTNAAVASEVLDGRVFWGLDAGEWGEQVGTASIPAYPGAVPKTGQTNSFTTADDGDLELGTAWPNPRFTDHGDGTVTDNLTGLVWLKNAYVANATRTWAQAFSDITELNTSGTMNGNAAGDTSNGGSHQTDWRLPNVRELQSLIDYANFSPALPTGHPFTNVQNASYWSSSTSAVFPGGAWFVNLHDGHLNFGNKSITNRVWPVRSGQ